MELRDFQAMIAPAGYGEPRVYEAEGTSVRHIYTSNKGAPRINIEVLDGVVDDYEALKIEAYLDEEGYFED